MKNIRPFLLTGLAFAALLAFAEAQATVYVDGVSPALSGASDLGTHLPNYIGPTTGDCGSLTVCGSNLDGTRVYLYDVDDHAGVLGPTA